MQRLNFFRFWIKPPLLGALLLGIATTFTALYDPWLERVLRNALFDTYQRLLPRTRLNDSVVVVEIDEQSLAELGQWPWPRSRIAGLIAQIADAGATVIALDALFVEADHYTPSMLALQLGLDPAAAAALTANLPDSDVALAKVLQRTSTVMGMAGVDEAPTTPPHTMRVTPIAESGGTVRAFLRTYTALLQNLKILDDAATARGALNVESDTGVIRRIPTLIADQAGTLVPSLAIETLRIASGRDPLRVKVTAHGMQSLAVAGVTIPTTASGEWWLHYSNWQERPSFSAARVFRGAIDKDVLRGRIVLIGFTALGLHDTITTPLGRMPGVEVHAEAIENAIDGRLLSRTRWMQAVELALLLTLGALAIFCAARLRPWLASVLFIATVCALLIGSVFAFVRFGWLLDVANPIVLSTLVFGATLGASLSHVQAQRRTLKLALLREQEALARVHGELNAARRIQLGMLPDENALTSIADLDVAGRMVPARAVGGDLYDFLQLDAQHVLFLIGDVSGKGLPSALFMALAKALIRGAALHTHGDPGATLTETNQLLAQHNPEMLFLTIFICVLNLDSGELNWSNAGHDSPYVATPDHAFDQPFTAAGPPLGAVDDFVYPTLHSTLVRNALICLFTDGITEAQNAAHELFGGARIGELLATLPATSSATTALNVIADAVTGFVGDTEQADDITLLCVRRR